MVRTQFRRRPAMFTRIFIVVLLLSSPLAALAGCEVVDPELQGFYEGGCRNGLAHGKGYARGLAEYDGEFRNGLKQGKGTKTWSWGDRYEGDFLEDRKHGKGMYVWGSRSPWAGERFVGEYKADRRDGWGIYYWPTGDRYEGQWKDDGRMGYSAMELRRQATAKATAEALKPGVQVCSWGQIGINQQVLQVGQIESVAENALQVRLSRLETREAAPVIGGPQPGTLLTGAPADWMPCL